MTRRSALLAIASASLSAMAGLPRVLADPTTQPAGSPEFTPVGKPVFDEKRQTWRVEFDTPFLKARAAVDVLIPDQYDADKTKRFPVLYTLPVDVGVGGRWGDALEEVRKSDSHNKHGWICGAPQFDTMPWYADHPTDPHVRIESHLKRAVIPLIESLYRVSPGRMGRLLVGYSKSGWGAMTLLFRDPEFFGLAGAWDAPLMLDESHFGVFQTAPNMGTKENFSAHLPTKLAEKAAKAFVDQTRIVLAGSDSFGPNPGGKFKEQPHLEGFHAHLQRLGIRHVYRDDLKVKHHWNTGWLGPVLDEIAKLADAINRQ